jgi:hypothetical protein
MSSSHFTVVYDACVLYPAPCPDDFVFDLLDLHPGSIAFCASLLRGLITVWKASNHAGCTGLRPKATFSLALLDRPMTNPVVSSRS